MQTRCVDEVNLKSRIRKARCRDTLPKPPRDSDFAFGVTNLNVRDAGTSVSDTYRRRIFRITNL